jgi:hypothetical protein
MLRSTKLNHVVAEYVIHYLNGDNKVLIIGLPVVDG